MYARMYDADNDSVNKTNLQSEDFIGKYYIYVEKCCFKHEICFHF